MTAATNGRPRPTVVVYGHRDRPRSLLRTAFPRKKTQLMIVRGEREFDATLRTVLVDAALVDIGGAHDGTWSVAARAREYPSIPFFGVASLRAVEAPAIAQCATSEFADVLVDGVDDAVARQLVLQQGFSQRFARALEEPPTALRLETRLQRDAWAYLVSHAGRPVRTSSLAATLDLTREHLSRSFAAGGGPNLKRVIDLVRMLAAAELAKNPGYDLPDIAAILGFASPSHLSSTALRVVGTKPISLARLRSVDLIGRFVRGHARSRH